jgi:hypothetical protein
MQPCRLPTFQHAIAFSKEILFQQFGLMVQLVQHIFTMLGTLRYTRTWKRNRFGPLEQIGSQLVSPIGYEEDGSSNLPKAITFFFAFCTLVGEKGLVHEGCVWLGLAVW